MEMLEFNPKPWQHLGAHLTEPGEGETMSRPLISLVPTTSTLCMITALINQGTTLLMIPTPLISAVSMMPIIREPLIIMETILLMILRGLISLITILPTAHNPPIILAIILLIIQSHLINLSSRSPSLKRKKRMKKRQGLDHLLTMMQSTCEVNMLI